jgi:hypothetical protein
MGKTKVIWLPLIGIALIIGWLVPSNSSNPPAATNSPGTSKTTTPSATPTETKTPTPTPTKTKAPKPEGLNYWPSGLKVVDITDSSSRNCTFDMCLILKLTALKTCSKITLDGTIYTADDEEVDTFTDDFAKLKKGKSRIIEFGTDASSDIEDYVDLDDSTCWK